MYWASNLPYFPSLLYFAASNALFIGPARWNHLAKTKLISSSSRSGNPLGTITNVLGLSVGKWLHNAGAIGTWLPIAILYFIGIACWWKFGSATSFAPAQLVPHAHFQDVLFWATIVFALGGTESASFLGDEIKNPRRNMPRALIIAGVIVTTGYILGSVAMLVALPASELSGLEGLMQAISHAAQKIGLGGLTPITALLITISNLGALGAWFAAVGRLPFVAGIDRYLPPAFGKLHPRWQSPYVALLVQAGCAIVFIFLGQAGASVYSAYEILVSIGIISYFIPYLYLFASLIKLQREPGRAGNYSRAGRKARRVFHRRAGICYLRRHDCSLARAAVRRAAQVSGGAENCDRDGRDDRNRRRTFLRGPASRPARGKFRTLKISSGPCRGGCFSPPAFRPRRSAPPFGPVPPASVRA